MTARWNPKVEGACPARLVEHTGHCLEISTKTTLQNHIKINIAPNFVKCSFNYPECSEKCIRGEYIVKYTGDRKILLTFQDEWIRGKFVDQLSDWLKLIK